MRKYVLFSFSILLVGFSILFNPHSVDAANCQQGENFDTTTGKRCFAPGVFSFIQQPTAVVKSGESLSFKFAHADTPPPTSFRVALFSLDSLSYNINTYSRSAICTKSGSTYNCSLTIYIPDTYVKTSYKVQVIETSTNFIGYSNSFNITSPTGTTPSFDIHLKRSANWRNTVSNGQTNVELARFEINVDGGEVPLSGVSIALKPQSSKNLVKNIKVYLSDSTGANEKLIGSLSSLTNTDLPGWITGFIYPSETLRDHSVQTLTIKGDIASSGSGSFQAGVVGFGYGSGPVNSNGFTTLFEDPITVNSNQAQPSITLLTPNGGESWTKGTNQKIKWKTDGVTSSQLYNIYIDSYNQTTSESLKARVADAVTGSSYDWQVGVRLREDYIYENNIIPNGLYLIRVCKFNPTSGDVTNCDSSNAPFTITSPQNPNPNLPVPKSVTLQWLPTQANGNVINLVKVGYVLDPSVPSLHICRYVGELAGGGSGAPVVCKDIGNLSKGTETTRGNWDDFSAYTDLKLADVFKQYPNGVTLYYSLYGKGADGIYSASSAEQKVFVKPATSREIYVFPPPDSQKPVTPGKAVLLQWVTSGFEPKGFNFNLYKNDQFIFNIVAVTSINPSICTKISTNPIGYDCKTTWNVPANVAIGSGFNFRVTETGSTISAKSSNFDISAPTTQTLPDLQITEISPTSQVGNKTIQYYATVKNVSSKNITTPFTVSIGGSPAEVSSLNAQQSNLPYATFGLSLPGPNQVCAKADVGGKISESNESNNEFCTSVHVKPTLSGEGKFKMNHWDTLQLNNGLIIYADGTPTRNQIPYKVNFKIYDSNDNYRLVASTGDLGVGANWSLPNSSSKKLGIVVGPINPGNTNADWSVEVTVSSGSTQVGSSQVYSPTSTGADGSAVFTVSVPKAGFYYLVGHVLSPTWTQDSFFVLADNGTPEDIWDTMEPEQVWPYAEVWKWRRVGGRGCINARAATNNGCLGPGAIYPKAYELRAGTNTITFAVRDAGTKIDKLCVTTKSDGSGCEGVVLGASLSSSYDFGSSTLKLGSTGSAVSELQKFLNASLGLDLPTEGNFGPRTEASVKLWQIQHGLVADGVVGPGTKKAMNASLAN